MKTLDIVVKALYRYRVVLGDRELRIETLDGAAMTSGERFRVYDMVEEVAPDTKWRAVPTPKDRYGYDWVALTWEGKIK